jgi:hypothetical protein
VATHHLPIHISLKDPNQYPCRPQFPISETQYTSTICR